VLFTDLRGFTAFAEQTAPDRVIEVLNRFLSEMSDAVLDNGGTLVSYLGDGLLAVFGAPIEVADHADRALAAAREMLSVRLPRFNQWADDSQPFGMGVGISSGPLMSGNVGSERRLDYTAIGDTVNVAARIEAHTKEVAQKALIADSTRKLLMRPAELVLVGDVTLIGRTAPTTLWGLAER
jgi:adenylate cyclase